MLSEERDNTLGGGKSPSKDIRNKCSVHSDESVSLANGVKAGVGRSGQHRRGCMKHGLANSLYRARE